MKRAALTAFIILLTLLHLPKVSSADIPDSIPGNQEVFRQIDSTLSLSGNGIGKAYELYRFFIESPLMGDENYAVYIAEKYILPVDDQNDKTMIRLFVNLNRQSMIGQPAQPLHLKDRDLNDIILPENSESKYRILFFYDIDCPKCDAEIKIFRSLSDKLPAILAQFNAIYTGSEMNRWIEHTAKVFPDSLSRTNLFDPEMSSGFVTRYGVISTPLTYVIDEDGFIIGKNIKAMDIPNLIDENIQTRESVKAYIEDIYQAASPQTYEEATYFSDRMIEQAEGDGSLFRIIVTDLFNRFRSSDNYDFAETADYIARKYILEMPGRWRPEFVEIIRSSSEKFNQNKLGNKAADLLLKDKDGQETLLSDLPKRYEDRYDNIVLYFFTPDCKICTATTLEIVDAASRTENTLFAFIYAGADYGSFLKYLTPELMRENIVLLENCDDSGEMFGKYDLTFVPAIYLLEKDMTIIAKDITPFTLKDLIFR